MFKRAWPFSSAAVGYFVLFWTILAHASTAQFTASVLESISGWLDAHAWAGFLMGTGLIALSVTWPRIQPKLTRFEWLKVRPTVHEHLTVIEETQVPSLRKKVENLTEELEAIDLSLEEHSRNIVDLTSATHSLVSGAGHTQATIEENKRQLSELSTSVPAVGSGLQSLAVRVTEHRDWIRSLELSVQSSETRLKGVAGHVLFVPDISVLITEADNLIEKLRRLVAAHPNSKPVKYPFSQAWWRQDATPEPPVALVEWALDVVLHLRHCAVFAAAFGIPQSQITDRTLQDRADQWNSTEQTAFCIEKLNSHVAVLLNARQEKMLKLWG